MTQHILYRHYDENGTLLYIGVSLSFFERLTQHKCHSTWFNAITTIKLQRFSTKPQMLSAEKKAIKKEKPIHNVQHSDLNKIIPNPVFTISQVAEKIGVSRRQIYKMIRDGRFDLKPIKGTKPRLWHGKAVQEWIEQWLAQK